MSDAAPVIDTLLVANRGEIAVRIHRTAVGLGIRTVGIYAPDDTGSMHVRTLHAAVEVPGYLDGAAIVAAAQATGAQAVHPGYGFLAEDAGFAQAVLDAGLVWVGPPPAAITGMGSKARARALAVQAGVPVIPGYDGDDQADATLAAQAARIGTPLLVKASAGGGGKGMQVVHDLDQLTDALAQARRLALAAFGDDRMILERFVSPARHVEVQILADAHGQVVALGERECSVQRRHQKVVEECPSPAFPGVGGPAAGVVATDAQRAQLHADAVGLARAVGYVGAGTVEFVLDAQGGHSLLEMNTRLQVEHPVTEAVHGVDLVAAQLAIAQGATVDAALELARRGPGATWAVEARLYAEDPAAGYLPATGTLAAFDLPVLDGVRVDAGVATGDVVGASYDPMLAKVVAWGPSRHVAVRRLGAALDQLVVLGPTTNLGDLRRILATPDFAAGCLSTSFLDTHPPPAPSPPHPAALAAVVLRRLARHTPVHPAGVTPGWRNNRWRDARLEVQVHGTAVQVDYRVLAMTPAPRLIVAGARVEQLHAAPVGAAWRLRLAVDGRAMDVSIADLPGDVERWHVAVHGAGPAAVVHVPPPLPVPGTEAAAGGLVAPMPGKVVAVHVAVGDAVQSGDALVVLEAMKMEQAVRAPVDGTITELPVAVGDQVDAGAVLAALEPLGAEAP